jgi:hypothetical protein
MAEYCEAGPRVALPRRSPRIRPDGGQVLARRHALWLNAVESGLFDPASGRTRPHTTSELARLFGVGIRAIQLGLAAARSTRDDVARMDLAS